MDSTGKIHLYPSQEKIAELMDRGLDVEPIEEGDMTEKQREELQVSKHDNRSVLGKMYREMRNSRRNRRKKLGYKLWS
jgi:hypothetical protein